MAGNRSLKHGSVFENSAGKMMARSAKLVLGASIISLPLISCIKHDAAMKSPDAVAATIYSRPQHKEQKGQAALSRDRKAKDGCDESAAGLLLQRDETPRRSACDDGHLFVLTDRGRLLTVFLDNPSHGAIEGEDGAITRSGHTSAIDISRFLGSGEPRWSCSKEAVCYFLIRENGEGKLMVVPASKESGAEFGVYKIEGDVSKASIRCYRDFTFISPVYRGQDKEAAMLVVDFAGEQANEYTSEIVSPEEWVSKSVARPEKL